VTKKNVAEGPRGFACEAPPQHKHLFDEERLTRETLQEFISGAHGCAPDGDAMSDQKHKRHSEGGRT